jgi:hypothetical protein
MQRSFNAYRMARGFKFFRFVNAAPHAMEAFAFDADVSQSSRARYNVAGVAS